MMNSILVILIDVGILALNITCAVWNRGTWIGWLFSALVVWQIFGIISAIRSTYDT